MIYDFMKMSTDDSYKIQSVHKYSRRTFSSTPENGDTVENCCDQTCEISSSESSSHDPEDKHDDPDRAITLAPEELCYVTQDDKVEDILHKKCMVINLAQLQMKKLLIDPDRLSKENNLTCRSQIFIQNCKDFVDNNRKLHWMVTFFIAVATISFLSGTIVGAATCGTDRGQFTSPLLTWLSNIISPNALKNRKPHHYGIY